jgi:hypothetical protein
MAAVGNRPGVTGDHRNNLNFVAPPPSAARHWKRVFYIFRVISDIMACEGQTSAPETTMEKSFTFGDVLEAADRLSLEEKEALIEVLQRRLVEQRRDELAKEIKVARKEFQAGKCQPASPEELMKDIL